MFVEENKTNLRDDLAGVKLWEQTAALMVPGRGLGSGQTGSSNTLELSHGLISCACSLQSVGIIDDLEFHGVKVVNHSINTAALVADEQTDGLGDGQNEV